ncbi:SDR family NAD(P)-dependent oxidoreductase [Aquihabitans daechungensis]|uniref:SDR family NAD(P)-dependent oxidoreductase n=1 Tax=Aquihabitans daechungensis TaxID=1052257 RepID=UPI003BA2CAE1
MRRTFDLGQRCSVVTGAASGIGRSIALALASRGSDVVALDLDGEGATATAAACSRLGTRSGAHELDVRDRSAWDEIAEVVLAEHGAPAVLVNSAGVGLSGPFLDTTQADWDWVIACNLRGVINGCGAFGPTMLAAGRGHLINVSSALALNPSATEPAYAATKAAVLALSASLRADWRPRGVSVTALCPGIVDTPLAGRVRFVGKVAGRQDAADAERLFARGTPPEDAAAAALRGIDRDLPVVLTGTGARTMAVSGAIPPRIREVLRRLVP